MAFLAPLFLGLAALAGVPLLVHLLRRRIGNVVEFPAVRYLLRMEKEHSRERKLKNRVLLLLRLLAVIALALAAARPVARLMGVGHAPIAAVLVIDNSMSSGLVVGGKTVLENLRNEGRSLLNSLAPDDRAWLVTADGKVTSGSPSSLQTALNELRPLGGRGDLRSALSRSISLAKGGTPRSPVVAVLTDGQTNAFGAASDSLINAENVPVVLLTPTKNASHDHGVLSAEPEPARWTPSGNVSANIMSRDSTPWRITLNGRTLARGTVDSGSYTHPAHLDARLSSATQGWLRGTIELDADELRGDDVRYFAVRVAPPPSVDIRSEAGIFAAAALGTLIDDGRIARTGVANTSGLSSEGVARVTVSGAESGGIGTPVLLIAPADPLRIGDANRTLARLNIPWRYGAVLHDTVITRGASQTTRTAADSAVEGTRVMLRYPLTPVAATASSASTTASAAPHVDTLAMAGGAPWAVAGAGYVLLASPMIPTATDLPIRPGFVPWLFGVVAMRLGDDGQLVHAVPGGRLSLPSDITGLELADGSVRPGMAHSGTAPAEPGVYFMKREGARVGALVVNAEPEESDLTQSSDKALLGRIAGNGVSAVSDGKAWRTQVLDQASGRSIVWPLIALALLALILESWIARLSATAVRSSSAASKTAPRSRAA
ncbi:MAG: BatA and WFA domain-containing protein [Gemmatimonadaceae bacterium]